MVEAEWPTGPRSAEAFTVGANQLLYRVLGVAGGRLATDFNPNFGEPTRFAFFADESGAAVPVLYAAYSAEAAVCETLLRDIPAAGGTLLESDYMGSMMAGLRTNRELNLVKFMGTGLRALGTTHQALTSSDMRTLLPDRPVGRGRTPGRVRRRGLDEQPVQRHRSSRAVWRPGGTRRPVGRRLRGQDLQQANRQGLAHGHVLSVGHPRPLETTSSRN